MPGVHARSSLREDDQALALSPLASERPRRGGITVEIALYGVFLVVAAATRFWDLGGRTLHHDESLHAYFSWLYATGKGYVHDPLMHGPFLFHANALVYFLLGASDATSRVMPALFGTALVGLPYFLRGPRHLGQWGALFASALLLLSPALLYQSRYIRHDIYTVVGSLLLFIGIVRYLERPERRWMVVTGASLGFLLTNHEIVFAVAAIFGGVLWGALLWGRLRPLVPLHVIVAVLAAGVWLTRPGPFARPLPTIPWDRNGAESPAPTRENQLRFYWEFLTHPLVILLAALAVVAVAAGFLLLRRRPEHAYPIQVVTGLIFIGVMAGALWAAAVVLVDEGGRTGIGEWQPLARMGGWRLGLAAVLAVGGLLAGSHGVARVRAGFDGRDSWHRSVLGGGRAGSVEAAVLRAVQDRAGLALAFGVGAAIFVVLYTSLFSNMEGLFTGTVATDGTLLYWLGQHEYRRGDQPWFYYLLLMPQYEFVAVLFGVAATAVTVWTAGRALARRSSVGPRFFFRLFLAVWFVGIFAGLSWAGEKMPWLVVHITLPGTLLAASLLGELVEHWQAGPAAARYANSGRFRGAANRAPGARWSWGEGALAAALLVVGASWFFLAASLSYGTFSASSAPGGWTRDIAAAAADRWWWLAIPPLAAVALVAASWIVRGRTRTGRAALVAVLAGLALLQVHAGWRTTYLEGDVPKDMLIYTQTSPDVSRMVDELGRLSAELTGGKGLEIWFDSGVSWPLQWYLRDFPNRQLRNGPLAGPPDDVPVVIVTNDRVGSMERVLDNYTAQEYVLRWWFPEYPIYRNFAIAPELAPGLSAWKSAGDPHGPIAIGASILRSLATQLEPEGQQRLYRLLMYRDLPERIDSYRYTVFVRNDLVPMLNTIRY